MILNGRVEFLVKQIIDAVAIVISARNEEAESVGELLANGDSAFVRIVRAIVERTLGAIDLFSFARNDIDDSEKGVVAVEDRAGAANDLDPIDEIDVEDEGCFNVGAVSQIIVHAVSVYQQQHSAVEISKADSSDPEECVIAVVRDAESRHAAQKVREGSVTELFDLVRCHDGYGRRGFGRFLLDFGCSVYFGNIQVHECLNREFSQVHLLLGGSDFGR